MGVFFAGNTADREGWKKQEDGFYHQGAYKASAIKTVVVRNGKEERIELNAGDKLPADAKLLHYERSIFRHGKTVTVQDTNQNALMFTKNRANGTQTQQGLDVEAKGVLSFFGTYFGQDMQVVKRDDKGNYEEGHLTRGHWGNPFGEGAGYKVEVDRDQRLEKNKNKTDIRKDYKTQKDLDRTYSESKNPPSVSDYGNKFEHNRFGKLPNTNSTDTAEGGKSNPVSSDIPAEVKNKTHSAKAQKTQPTKSPANTNTTNAFKPGAKTAVPPTGDAPTGVNNAQTTSVKATASGSPQTAKSKQTAVANNAASTTVAQGKKDTGKTPANNAATGGSSAYHTGDNRSISASSPN